MTVKKRLFVSNLMMIIVPVFITALIAAGCVGLIWNTFVNGNGIGFEDSEDFYKASAGISSLIEEALYFDPAERDAHLEALSSFLDRGSMSLQVEAGNSLLYSYGSTDEKDELLLKAASHLGYDGMVSNDGRSLYAHNVNIDDTNYRILIYGKEVELSYRTLKITIVLAAIILLMTVVISIIITNRFLTKFVIRKIEQPLDILADGVREIRDGNLDYRINYYENDEFAEVCSDFNEMAMRLKVSVELTQQHERSRKQLMAGISHDLRTPLTSIQAYVEGLLDGVAKTPEMQRTYLETIKNKAEDIARMVRQIFMFSKIELEEYTDNPVKFYLGSEIAELVDGIKEEYAEKGLIIQTDLEPAVVYADPEQIQRIIINIIENSLKYKSAEVGEMFIELKRTQTGCRLVMRDNGPGVKEEELSRLFDAFFRSDPARQNSNKGSGLGLSIAKHAVHRMNGTIRAQNVKDGGLEIVIELPKAET